jgi:hypothetical protein
MAAAWCSVMASPTKLVSRRALAHWRNLAETVSAGAETKRPDPPKWSRTFELPLLGSNQDSPGPESVPPGQRFRSTCPETVTSRASVPASLPQHARFCPEKL